MLQALTIHHSILALRPMITIKNSQRTFLIDTKQVQALAQKMLAALEYPDFDLGIWFTSNKTISRYNKQYRGKNKPTDILSFSFHDTLQPGERITTTNPDEKNLGDLIISLQYAHDDLERWGHSFEEHIRMLLAHGIAHLLNYDHETDEEYEQMQVVEKKLLEATKSLKLKPITGKKTRT